MSKPYKECPLCGVHLDYGERCDCTKATTQTERDAAENAHTSERSSSYYAAAAAIEKRKAPDV